MNDKVINNSLNKVTGGASEDEFKARAIDLFEHICKMVTPSEIDNYLGYKVIVKTEDVPVDVYFVGILTRPLGDHFMFPGNSIKIVNETNTNSMVFNEYYGIWLYDKFE